MKALDIRLGRFAWSLAKLKSAQRVLLLRTDESSESRQAEQLLKLTRIEFQVERINGSQIGPELVISETESFLGLAAIKFYLRRAVKWKIPGPHV